MSEGERSRTIDAKVVGELGEFLDDLVLGHREQMDKVVSWLWRSNRLESEIQASVGSISNLFQKWTFEILFLLRMRNSMRFNQLKEQLGAVGVSSIKKRVSELTGVSSRTLSARLKELESQGLVERTVYPEVPVRVEYKLTEKALRFGDLVMPVIAYLRMIDAETTS